MNASKKKSLASKSSFAIPESVGNMLGSIVLATETDPHKRFKIEKYKKDSFLKRSMDVYPHDPKKGSFPALKINSVILDEPEKGDESYMITKVDKDEGLLMPLLMPEDQLKSKALLEERQSKKVDIKEIPIAKDNFGLGDKPWHLYGAKELLEELESDLKTGLSSEEHAIRLDKYGPNLITPAKQMHWIIKLILNMVGGFQLFLWAGGILCLIVFFITSETDYQTLALGLLCFIVVILTSLFQSYQEGKSDEVMAALRALTPQTVFVIRNGLLMEVQADSLVPGDICNVKAGEKVPADLRILKSSDLKVNNASLTGENVDIKLGSEAHSESLYEAKNIARMGCNFTAGTGIAVVFSTGDNTFFGTIAKSTTTIKRPDSCLKKEIKRLVHIMGAVAITIGVIFLILALKFGYSTIEAIVFMIGIIVANVPEGLLPQLTVALTLTAQRMQKKGVVVSNLDIIETLGATTVICSDKTGTLTCNRMTVSHVVYDRKIHKTPESPDMGAEFMEFFEPNDEHFKTLQRIATLNTDAEFLTHETDVLKRMTKGDASESALIKFLQPIRDIIDIRRECPRVFGIPFNSTNKWMCSIHDIKKQSGSNNLLLMVKGAPEKIISMCEKIYRDGQIQNLTPEGKSELEKINDTLAKHGERVLAFADSVLDEHFNKEFPFEQEPVNFPMNNLVFAGFFSLIDPPRPTVKHAIEDCHTAGIKVFMVTGDHPTTAQAIAKSLNLITQPTEKDLIQMKEPIPIEGCHSIVITGSELLTFTEQDWDRVLKHQEIVFARTMPQQKQDIVRELNKLGHIVAMTGDGVNDAPALKAAHIGIAMGSGAAVAKEAGQLVLLEDDFGSIVEGIREGRLIFENLKKTICYVLSSNIPELIPFLLFIAMRIPLSIETIMIILIDVGTDLAPAVALAYEEPEDLIMSIPPRTKDNHLVGIKLMLISYVFWGVILTFGSYWSFFYVFYDHGFTVSSLIGAGANIRDSWSSLADDRKNFFKDLCENNTWVKQNNVNDRCNDNVMGSFMDDLVDTLAVAQSAYFMAIVWGQLAAIFIRKTQMASLFTWYRLTCNKAIYVAIVIELAILFIVVYIPGLNHALMYTSVSSKWSVTALWVIPVIIILDEFRKFICRLNPKGKFAKYTTL